MTKLNAKEEAFIARMQQSLDLQAHGYEALIRKGKARRFFEPLNAAGFFRPERNPRPVQEGNGVRVPAWPALQFLLAVAKEVPQGDDAQSAQAIMNIIRVVSRTQNADGVITANFFTWRIFAELLGLLPLTAIADDDISFIQRWIEVPFNNGLIVQALDEGLLVRLLDSGRPEDAVRAVAVFEQCTRIRSVESAGRKEIRTVGDPHWVNRMVEHHARTLGRRAGAAAAKMASERLRETFTATSTHESVSSAYRAAVEEHDQNGDWHEAESTIVRALRDVLLGWCSAGSTESTEFVVHLLREGIEMQRRVALFAISEAWEHFSFDDVLASNVFRPGHLHELYNLLVAHCSALTTEQKDKVVQSIAAVALNDLSDEGRAHFQARILHAIAGRGFEPADKLLTSLESRFPGLRDGEKHWDFHSYTETRIGPGPSAFSPQELVAFAEEGTLRERVESFKEGDRWSGPTREGLIDNIKAASRSDSQAFIRRLPDLHDAGYDLVYPVLHGIKASWDEESADRRPEWRERVRAARTPRFRGATG
jgi:hypothetical protein